MELTLACSTDFQLVQLQNTHTSRRNWRQTCWILKGIYSTAITETKERVAATKQNRTNLPPNLKSFHVLIVACFKNFSTVFSNCSLLLWCFCTQHLPIQNLGKFNFQINLSSKLDPRIPATKRFKNRRHRAKRRKWTHFVSHFQKFRQHCCGSTSSGKCLARHFSMLVTSSERPVAKNSHCANKEHMGKHKSLTRGV